MKNWSQGKWHEIGLALILVGLMPLLFVQGGRLWERAHFQFFPIAWIGIIFLTFRHGEVTTTPNLWRQAAGGASLVCGGAIAIWSALSTSPWLAQLSAILVVSAWGLVRLGSLPLASWLSWTLLMWITLPLPLGYDEQLVQQLQTISSESTGLLLDLFGIVHLRQGNLIEIRAQKLFVDEACSGVDSLYSLFAIAMLIIVLQKRPFLVSTLLLMSVPAWAWLGNVMRLTLIASLLDYCGVDLTGGWHHSLLGIAIFGFSTGCMYLSLGAVTELLSRLSYSVLPRDGQWHSLYNAIVSWPGSAEPVLPTKVVETVASTPPQIGVRRFAFALTSLLVMISLASGVYSIKGLRAEALRGIAAPLPHFEKALVDQMANAEAMPKSLGNGVRLGFSGEERSPNNFKGEYSRTWQYVVNGTSCLVSLDFPFRGFHPLWVCYQNAGCVVNGEPQTTMLRSADGTEWPIVESQLTDDLGGTSYVWFAMFDVNGKPIAVPSYTTGLESLPQRLRLAKLNELEVQPLSFQCQLVVQAVDILSVEQKRVFQDMLVEALPQSVGIVQQCLKSQ